MTVAGLSGDYDRARALSEESVAVAHEIGAPAMEAVALRLLLAAAAGVVVASIVALQAAAGPAHQGNRFEATFQETAVSVEVYAVWTALWTGFPLSDELDVRSERSRP